MAQAPTTQLIANQRMEQAELCALRCGQAIWFSALCPTGKEKNEDAAALFSFKDGCVLAVADGMGGLPLAAEAASVALKSLQSSLEARDGKLRNAILNGFEKANQAVLALGQGAGTTLSVVEIQKDRVRPYHAGDSLILLLGQRGKVKWQSVSHSPVGYALQAGHLNEKEALRDPQLNIVSNMIGSSEMRIELGPELTMGPKDTLILASDGLSDNFLTEEIVDRARAGSLPDVSVRLIQDCWERMNSQKVEHPSKPDDLTFIVFRLKNAL